MCHHFHADEAFAAKHMPELGHDVRNFKVFTWRLSNWKKLEKKLTSPDFECGGHKWYAPVIAPIRRPYITTALRRRILLFPFGNSNAPPNDTVSVYLDYAEPKKAPEGWHACAQFALVISNIHDPTIYSVSRKSFSQC
jgi:ubiquitin carboxyl-terminal hydrolase 7